MTIVDIPARHSRVSTLEQGRGQHGALAAGAGGPRLVAAAALAAPIVAAAGGAWLLSRGGRRSAIGAYALGAGIGLGLVRWQLARFLTENVPYELEATVGEIELRSYPARAWVETVVESLPWRRALNEGFRRLGAYLFGRNAATERFPMTAPVLSSLPAPPDRDTPEPGAAEGSSTVSVAFVLPGLRTLRDLPLPRDRRVRLRAVPERLVAALRFRGGHMSRPPTAQRDELLRRLHEAGIKFHGEVMFAAYDPPTTLPWLRRNEVMVEL